MSNEYSDLILAFFLQFPHLITKIVYFFIKLHKAEQSTINCSLSKMHVVLLN